MSVFNDLEQKAKAAEAKDIAAVESTARKLRGYIITAIVAFLLGVILPHVL